MATNTTKLALSKPDGTDLVDVSVLNTNFDKIDAASGATICTSSTRPASPWNGQVIFETDTLNALVYRTSTTSWNILGGSTVSSEPPAGAGNGNFWWDSDNGKLYIYYNDGNSSQWVSVMPSQTTVDVSQNYLINGAFEINQRGFTSSTAPGYGFDRWTSGSSGGTQTYSSQTFTPGAAPVAGYEAKNYARIATSGQSATTDHSVLLQYIEDVRTLAGQTATISFWAKADSGTPKVAVEVMQSFGSGGSPSASVFIYAGQVTLSTSWARYSVTVNVPSISSKTIGTTSNTSSLIMQLWTSAGSGYAARTGSLGIQNTTIDFWGVQVEKGSVATSFKRAAGTIDGELAACQRYFEWCTTSNRAYSSSGYIGNTLPFKVEKRVNPTITLDSNGTSGGTLGAFNSYVVASKINGTPQWYCTAGTEAYYYNALFKVEAEF